MRYASGPGISAASARQHRDDLLEHGEHPFHLRFTDHERRFDFHNVAELGVLGFAKYDPALEPFVDKTVGFLESRFFGLLAAHQLDPDHQPRTAHVADQLVLVLHRIKAARDFRTQPARTLEQTFTFD